MERLTAKYVNSLDNDNARPSMVAADSIVITFANVIPSHNIW